MQLDPNQVCISGLSDSIISDVCEEIRDALGNVELEADTDRVWITILDNTPKNTIIDRCLAIVAREYKKLFQGP